MEQTNNGGFFNFLKRSYDEANKDNENAGWLSKLRNAYHFTVEYPAVVEDALNDSLLQSQTRVGLRLAIEDTLNGWNKHKAGDISRFAEEYMRPKITEKWEQADQRAAIIDYLKERDHQRQHDVPSDFDRAKERFPFLPYDDHIQTIAEIIDTQFAIDELVQEEWAEGYKGLNAQQELTETINSIRVEAQNARIFGADGAEPEEP